MKTLKDTLNPVWSVYACSEDECHYLIKGKTKLEWKTIDKIKDCRDMVICDTEKEILKITNQMKKLKLPKLVNKLQIVKAYPTVEDNKFWTNEIKYYDLNV